MSTEVIDLLTTLSQKVDKLSEEISLLKSAKKTTKATPAKIEQFKVKTADFLSTKDKLCAYMQKGDCEGHCGRKAQYSVINGNPIELSDIKQDPPKDERKASLRKAFYRCTTCRNKGKNKDTSRGYSKIYDFIYDNKGDEEVFDEDELKTLSPERKEESKKKKGAKAKAVKESDDDEGPNVSKGLDEVEEDPSPEDRNKHLKKTDKFHDNHIVVKIGKSQKHCITRSFKDKRKNDVCIGELSGEPDDSDYEDDLKEPSSSLLEKIKLKYKTPADSIKETPPKAAKKKKPQVAKDDSDDSESDDSDADSSPKGEKDLKKEKKDASDSDDSD